MHVVQRHFTKVLSAVCILLLFLLINKMFLKIDPNFIRGWIISWGWWAPLIFLIMFTARPFTLFPSSLLAIAGGLAFGVWTGTLYTWIGSLSGAVVSFWAARKLGKSFVKKEWPGYTGKIQAQLEKRGFFFILVLRLIPVLNFDMVSYLAAISKVRFRGYFFGTLLGIIPGAFAYAFLGSSVASGEFRMVMIAVAILLIMLAVPFALRKKVK